MKPSLNSPSPIPTNHQLWEAVLTSLRIAILTGQLAPHTHLVETELGRCLQVSRGPIREALVHLEREGLVVNHPYRGKFVADISLQYIREVYTLRQLLENYAVMVAMEEWSPKLIDQLQALLDQMIEEVTASRYEEFAATDLEFHRVIVAAGNNKLLLQMWETLTKVTHATIAINARSDPAMVQLVTEGHQAIVDGLAKRNLAEAQRAVTSHILAAQERILRTMNAPQS